MSVKRVPAVLLAEYDLVEASLEFQVAMANPNTPECRRKRREALVLAALSLAAVYRRVTRRKAGPK